MSEEERLNAEISELKTDVESLEQQLKNCMSERDLLAIMLNEASNAARAGSASTSPPPRWLHAAGEFEHDPATVPSNKKLTFAQLFKLVEELSPENQEELERRLAVLRQNRRGSDN